MAGTNPEADSSKQTIWHYHYNGDTGTISDKRIFATTRGNCFPDGSIEQIIKLPISQPSCIAFGGPDKRCLLQQPQAGSLFSLQTEITGLAEGCYKCIVTS